MPRISKWYKKPNSCGKLCIWLSNKRSVFRLVHIPISGGSSEIWLLDTSKCRKCRSFPISEGSLVSWFDAR